MEGLLVNGPINAVRLEGDFASVHKVIYLFMDIHSDISIQTQCKNFHSIDFVHYIVSMFKLTNKNKIYDLFTEISGTAIASPDYPYRGRYIDEINRYLKSEFKSKNKINPNVRVHYIDIRDFLKTKINISIYNIYNTIKSISSAKFVSKFDYGNLTNFIRELYSHIDTIYSLMFGSKLLKRSRTNKRFARGVPTRSQDESANLEIIKKFLNKIMSRYEHPELPRVFKPIFDLVKSNFEIILNILDQISDLMKRSYDFLSKPNDALFLQDYKVIQVYSYGKDTMRFLEFIYNMEKLVIQVDILCVYNFATVVDLFFLRRFLDKNYVTNGIAYTGAAHSIFYIFFLVKYFDFKITNVSYSSIKNLKEIGKIIKLSDFGPQIEKIFMPPIFSQCVDMTYFPKGFE